MDKYVNVKWQADSRSIILFLEFNHPTHYRYSQTQPEKKYV